jgi:hypothetical protein
MTGAVRADNIVIEHARSSPNRSENDNWQQITSTLDMSCNAKHFLNMHKLMGPQ